MKIFLTGASGFLGQKVLRRLVTDGHRVLALSRSEHSDSLISAAAGIPIRGDITQAADFKDKLYDIDVVVHCAAPVEFWGKWKKFENGIVAATIDLAKASAKSGVKRFIHISSESVLQDKKSLIDIDESELYPDLPNSYYGKAKKITEELLLSADLVSSMEIIILRPTFIWGKGANALKTITEKVRSGQFMWVDGGSADFEAVHVENVVEAIALAITKGLDREIYFITDDERASVKDFFTRLIEKLNLQVPTKSMPGYLAIPAAHLVESIWTLARIKKPPPLSRFDLSFVNMPRRYNISKAKDHLGYKPILSRTEGFASLV